MRIFFFNDTATTEIYTLSLHDALPISSTPTTLPARVPAAVSTSRPTAAGPAGLPARRARQDRKSTRLNSSHSQISYAVFCLEKKKSKLPYGQVNSVATSTWTQHTLSHT